MLTFPDKPALKNFKCQSMYFEMYFFYIRDHNRQRKKHILYYMSLNILKSVISSLLGLRKQY